MGIGRSIFMQEIKIEVSFIIPELNLSEKEQGYLNQLIKEVLEREGNVGLFIALETYLGK